MYLKIVLHIDTVPTFCVKFNKIYDNCERTKKMRLNYKVIKLKTGPQHGKAGAETCIQKDRKVDKSGLFL